MKEHRPALATAASRSDTPANNSEPDEAQTAALVASLKALGYFE